MVSKNNDIVEIDLARLLRALLRRLWAIVLSMLVFGSAFLGYTYFYVTPKYQASALMYVNSNDISVGGTKVSISQGELSTAQALVDTYIVILRTRTTLEDVIERTGVPYSYGQLLGMISAASVDGTEVFRIQVTSTNPEEAMVIANAIAQVLPEKISAIVEGTSARIVETAVTPSVPTSPSYKSNLTIGVLLGAVLACGVIVVLELIDDKIHDTDYLTNTYDLPILSVIPDLLTMPEGKDYRYYRRAGEYVTSGERKDGT